MMDYCNGVEGFINYALSNPTNINEGGIRCPCKKYKNKDFYYPDGVTMRLLYKKKIVEKCMCWYTHEEPYVPRPWYKR
jgi:hypothetical protein